MKNLAMIACVSADRGIGQDNQLLWRLKPDMQFFRQTTQGHTVIMGRKTFESLGRPLPQRKNIVLSHQKIDSEGVTVLNSDRELRDYINQHPEETIFIIGGAKLYEMFCNDVHEIYLTEVQASKPADTFFPEFDKSKFDRRILESQDVDGVRFDIIKYTRRENSREQYD